MAVAVGEDAVGRIHEVAAACRAVGFEHDMTLVAVGVLTGFAELALLPELCAVPGVLAVETERAVPASPRGARH